MIVRNFFSTSLQKKFAEEFPKISFRKFAEKFPKNF